MKLFLCIALVAAALVATEARATTNRELIDLLEKLVKKEVDNEKLVKKEVDNKDADIKALHDAINALIKEHAPEFADTPTYKVDPEVIGKLFGAIIKQMMEYSPKDMADLVIARFARSFMSGVIYDGVNHVWEVAGGHINLMYEMNGENPPVKKHLPKRRIVKREEMGGEGPVDYWGAVFSTLVEPNYNVIKNIYSELEACDRDYHGDVFIDLYMMSEYDGLLSKSLTESTIEVGHVLGYAMFQPPSSPCPADLLAKVTGHISDWIEMQKMANTDFVAYLPIKEEEKKLVVNVLRSLIPLIADYIKPVETFVELAKTKEGLEDFFLIAISKTLEENYAELNAVVQAVDEGAKAKADVLGRLIKAMEEGRGMDVFKSLFIKMAHHALSQGYGLEEYMYWAGGILDQVDADINGKPLPLEDKGTGNPL
jgi:hypothetical protein